MSFVRNAWYVGAWSSEVAARPLHRRICGEVVLDDLEEKRT